MTTDDSSLNKSDVSQALLRFGMGKVAKEAARKALEARMANKPNVETMFKFETKEKPKTTWEMASFARDPRRETGERISLSGRRSPVPYPLPCPPSPLQKQDTKKKEVGDAARSPARSRSPGTASPHGGLIPEWRKSQPGAKGLQAALPVQQVSFDPLHPALATAHYLRSHDQEAYISEAKCDEAIEQLVRLLRGNGRGAGAPDPL